MPTVQENKLCFEFPEDWKVTKYDNWDFYRKQFNDKLCKRLKATDILAIDPQNTVWFIEIKDLRREKDKAEHERTNPETLPDTIVLKVLHTLAALLPARLGSSKDIERNFAENVLQAKQLRVVLHLEYPKDIDESLAISVLANIQQELRRKFKRAIDPHPLVVEMTNMQDLPWTVSSST